MKANQMGLGLSERSLHRLCTLLDEDFSGKIELEEYYFALDVYGCRCEETSCFEKDPNFVPFLHRTLFKLIDGF